MIVNRVNRAAIGALQIAAKLQIIRRVCKHHIDTGVRQAAHSLYTIHAQNLVERQVIAERRNCLNHPLGLRLYPLNNAHISPFS